MTVVNLLFSLKTPVIFIPNTYPPEPSSERQRAIEQGFRAPLPRDDPYGWFHVPQVRVLGLSPLDQMPLEVIYNVRPAYYLLGFRLTLNFSFRLQLRWVTHVNSQTVTDQITIRALTLEEQRSHVF